jgi:hypothetical protein
MANDDSQPLVLFKRILDELWIANDTTAVGRYFHPDAEITGIVPNEVLNREDYKDLAQQLFELSRLQSYRVLETVADPAGPAVYLIEMDIRNLATEQIAVQSGLILLDLKEGLLHRVHIQVDLMKYFQDLGLLPDEAALLCLSGIKLS